MKSLALGLAFAAMASAASAGFVGNRTQWEGLGSGKPAFAMGLVDAFLVADSTSPYGVANVEGLFDCLRDLELTPTSMVTLIDDGYRDVSKWRVAPVQILNDQLNKVCRTYMDTRRVAAGLEPFPPLED